VLLSPDGAVVGEGYHRGAGTPHAEVEALRAAGAAASGATAVVTLEPCRHHGRTGPCTDALLAAAVRRVVYAQADPNPVAAGGAAALRAAAVDVEGGLLADEARLLNAEWSVAVARGRPFVTLKTAATLDGRVAAPDGSSRWITGPAARADVHELRGRCDAVLVGTGTVLADDPQLTVRDAAGIPLPAGRQPLRVVVGERAVPPTARVLDAAAPTVVLPTRDLSTVLADLARRDCQHVLVEGGPTLAAAAVRAGLVDRVVVYLAPAWLGAGPPAMADLGITGIAGAHRLRLVEVTAIGGDVRIVAEPLEEVH
jgi:diaminohydroxyphosphoribosylaminopyrimidine deaminase/5-amino-6-(5-phosphoribosylamino)uracil reductase